MVHFIYGLTHPERPAMGALYLGSCGFFDQRWELHRAGETGVVSRGCKEWGLDPSRLEMHVLQWWWHNGKSPEYEMIREWRSVGQAEFNKKRYAFTGEDSRKGGRKGGLAAKRNGGGIFAPGGRSKGGRKGAMTINARLTPKQKSEVCRKGGLIGGRKSGLAHKQNGTGVFGLTSEQTRENACKGGHAANHLRKNAFSVNCAFCQADASAAWMETRDE